MTGYDNRRTYGSYNPFDAIQSTPYVSMRNDLPFDLYMDVLSKGEERYQKGLEVESKIDMALGNINAYGERGNKKLKDLRENIKSELQTFSSKAGSYADPDVLNAMTKYANSIGSKIKPFIEYENMKKADEELRFKEPNPVEIDLPQTDMFDENGNPIPYKRNWQPGLDYAKSELEIMKVITPDIDEILSNTPEIYGEGLLKVSTKQIKQINKKLDAGANLYLSTDAGTQQVLAVATQLQKNEGIPREEALLKAEEQVKNKFKSDAIIMNGYNKKVDLMSDPTYIKKENNPPEQPPNIFTTTTPKFIEAQKYFKTSEDLITTNISDDKIEGTIKKELFDETGITTKINTITSEIVENIGYGLWKNLIENYNKTYDLGILDKYVNETKKDLAYQMSHSQLDPTYHKKAYDKVIELQDAIRAIKDKIKAEFNNLSINNDGVYAPIRFDRYTDEGDSAFRNVNQLMESNYTWEEFKYLTGENKGKKVENKNDLSLVGMGIFDNKIHWIIRDKDGVESNVVSESDELNKELLRSFESPQFNKIYKYQDYELFPSESYFLNKKGEKVFLPKEITLIEDPNNFKRYFIKKGNNQISSKSYAPFEIIDIYNNY